MRELWKRTYRAARKSYQGTWEPDFAWGVCGVPKGAPFYFWEWACRIARKRWQERRAGEPC